jgi:GPH family glycoside/pentoside/hexuronide:cation symporter
VGLQAEATADYHERTRLTGTTQVFFFVFAILPNWLFAIAQQSFFTDPVQGFHWIGLILAFLFFFGGLLPIFLCRERLYASVAAKHANASLAQHARAVFSNRPFAVLLATVLVCNFGYHVVNILGMYANFYYVYGGDFKRAAIMQGWNGTTFQLTAVFAAFAYPKISKGLGKRGALLLAMIILMAGSLAKWVLYQPDHPWLQVFVSCANSFSMTGISVLGLSMMADTVDFGELTTGERNEGLYASALQICERIGYSIGTLLSGFILSGIGFNVRLLGAQTPHTLQMMRLLYAASPFVGALGAAIVLIRYPLTEAKVYAVKAELDKRRGSAVTA